MWETVKLESTLYRKKLQSRKVATQRHLFNVGLQDVILFLGLLELLGQFVSNLVQLLLKVLVRTLQLRQLLQCDRDSDFFITIFFKSFPKLFEKTI